MGRLVFRRIATLNTSEVCASAQVADETWVDADALQTRQNRRHPAERHYLCRRLHYKEHTS